MRPCGAIRVELVMLLLARPSTIAQSGRSRSPNWSPHVTTAASKSIDVTTSKRYDATMSALKRITVYFEPELHRALQLKALETERSVSDLVNQAVRDALAEDADDIAEAERRRHETPLRFEDVVAELKRRGKL